MHRATFGPFILDLDRGELQRSGVPVRLQPQPAKLLVLLVGRAGELVTRDEIRERVWGSDTFVDFDQSVNFCVRQVRTALHDDASTPCYIETVPRRGYRFIAPVVMDPGFPSMGPVVPATVRASARSRWLLAAGVLALSAALMGLAATRYARWVRNGVPASGARSGHAREEVALGQFFLDKFSTRDLETAIGHFEAALRIDPDCASAYAGLAEAYNQQASVFLSTRRPAEVRLLAMRAATRAIQLDPRLAEAYAALGYATMHEMDWERAGAALRRAIELNPRYVPAHQIYAAYLADQRRFREAIDEARISVDLEPASVRGRRTLGWMLYFARQYDEALRELRTVVQMDPSQASGHFGVGEILLVTGRAAEAVSELEAAVSLSHRAPAPVGLLGMAFGASGRPTEARRVLDELELRARTENIAPGALLLGYIGVGDKGRAVDMIVRGLEERDNYEINIAVDPLMDPLRTEPRFETVCRKVMLGSSLDPSARGDSGRLTSR